MALPKAQLKAFIDELSKIGDKSISKVLNGILFRPNDEEVSMMRPQLQGGPANIPAGQADLGMGQSTNAVGSSQMVSPAVGPGGV